MSVSRLGQVEPRQQVVADFQKETGACVFLLSLRAAGLHSCALSRRIAVGR